MNSVLMRRLGKAGYTYCAASLLFFLLLLTQITLQFDWMSIRLILFFLIHTVAQFNYVYRTMPLLHLRVWKESHSLDDFLTNTTELDTKVTGISNMLKFCAVLGTLGTGFLVFVMALNLPAKLAGLSGDWMQLAFDLVGLTCLVTGVCVFIYNIRTFGVRWIHDEVPSS